MRSPLEHIKAGIFIVHWSFVVEAFVFAKKGCIKHWLVYLS